MIDRVRAAIEVARTDPDALDVDALLDEIRSADHDPADVPALIAALDALHAVVADVRDGLAADLHAVGRRRAATGYASLQPARKSRRHTAA